VQGNRIAQRRALALAPVQRSITVTPGPKVDLVRLSENGWRRMNRPALVEGLIP
jgi:hypothetical protein